MKTRFFGMSVDDVALRDWSTPEALRNLLDFFENQRVPATFFVVPVDETTNLPFYAFDERYLPLIKSAHDKGFEFEQHGIRHNRFELGVPPLMILNLPHEKENKLYAEKNQEFLRNDHNSANCMERLNYGRKILEDALGFKIHSFRAPSLQESPGMFEALEKCGYTFDTSACLQETGWDYIMNDLTVPRRKINRERYEKIRQKISIPLLPLTTDYVWFLTKEKYDATMKLAQQDFLECMENDIPFVTVCHVTPVFEGEGIKFLTEFYDWCRKTAEANDIDLKFLTLNEIAKEIK